MSTEENTLATLLAAMSEAFPGATMTFCQLPGGQRGATFIRSPRIADVTGEGVFSINTSGPTDLQAALEALNTLARWASQNLARQGDKKHWAA